MDTIVPMLLFVGEQHGKAEEAVNLYVSLFPDSTITHIERHGPDEGETPGTIKQMHFTLRGRGHRAMDSGLDHGFSFTPAISLFVTCAAEAELDRLYENLSADGAVLMPLDKYPFSRKYAWVQDRFGVSWQLHLP